MLIGWAIVVRLPTRSWISVYDVMYSARPGNSQIYYSTILLFYHSTILLFYYDLLQWR